MNQYHEATKFPGVDFSEPQHVARLGRYLARKGEHLYAFNPVTQHVLTCAPGDTDSAMDLAKQVSVDPKAPDPLNQAIDLAHSEGLYLVGFDGRSASGAPLLSYVEPLRHKIARILTEGSKATKFYEVHVEVTRWSVDEPRPDEIQVRARLLNLDASTAANLWKSVMGQIPELTGVWRSSFDASTGVVTWRHGDPLSQSIAYRWNEPVSYTSIPFGAGEDGETVFTGLYEYNILLGGLPKSGKSGGATSLLAGISRLEHCALVGLDPKRVELGPWRSRFTVVAKRDDHASEVLKALVEEMERRYEWLEERDLKKVPPEKFAEMPLIVVLIDELADLVSIGVTKEEKAAESQREAAIRRLIAKGRAAGFVIIAATQKPSSDVISTSLRDLIQQRVAFKTTNLPMTETILGQGQAANGGVAHEIPMGQSGTAFIMSEDNPTPTRVRAFWIPDEDVRGLAEQTAHLRVPLPFLPQENGASSGASVRPAAPASAPSWDDLDDLEPAPVPVSDFIL